jgi:hypothetical protein
MPTATYEKIESQTVSAQAIVSFTAIPSTYTDLIIIAVAKSTNAGSSVNNYRFRFNNDTTSVYSDTFLYGSSGGATSSRDANQNEMYIGLLPQTSIQPETSIFHVMNYANTAINKTVISRGNAASGDFVSATVGLWRKNDAINRVDIYMSSPSTLAGTFNLYGIKAA